MKDSNTLIAEFMGKTVYPIKGTPEFKKWKGELCDYDLSEIKYHISWDWLMPVIQKIRELSVWDDDINSYGFQFDQVLFNYIDSEISTVYADCVKFIEWHNQNNKSI